MMTYLKPRAVIVGTGSYLPANIVTNDDLAQKVDTSDEWIKSRTGIRERRILAEAEATSDMCVKAAERALKDADISAAELDLIVVGTVTPDMLFPSTACIVQDKIGAKKATAFDLSAGCTGFIYALATGSSFLEAGLYKNALVIGSDAVSRVVDWSDRGTCVLFGDGAGAVVLQASNSEEGIIGSYLRSDGSGAHFLHLPAGGSRLPATVKTINDALHSLKMEGREVFKFAVKAMEEATRRVLEENGLSLEEVNHLIPHQANIRIIESSLKRLGLAEDKVFVNLHKYGNMSGASVPVALDEAAKQGKFKKGDLLVLVAFGAGLTWGSSAVRWAK